MKSSKSNHTSKTSKSMLEVGKIFSLRQLTRLDPGILVDKIFELQNEMGEQEAYKYVMLKVTNIRQKKSQPKVLI